MCSFFRGLAHIVAIIIAIIQAMFSCSLLLGATIFFLQFRQAMKDLNDYKLVIYIIEIFIGPGVVRTAVGAVGFYVYLVLGLVLAVFIICVLLCKGLCERKPWYILVYIICGVGLLSVGASFTTSDLLQLEYYGENRKATFWGRYTAYILLLVGIFIDLIIKQKRKKSLKRRQQYNDVRCRYVVV